MNKQARESIRVGEELRRRLAAEGWSQKEIALEMKVTQPRISRVLAGEFTPRSELARRLCARFAVAPPDAHDWAAERALADAQRSLYAIWDGTAPGARQLRALVRAVRSVKTSADR